MNAELPKLFEHSLTLRGAIGLGLQAVLDAAKDAGFAVEVTDVKLLVDKPEQRVPFEDGSVSQKTAQAVQNAAAALRP